LADGDAKRFVRVKRYNPRGFVEFEYAIGDPSLCLDMILPPAAFRAFCRDHQVRFLRPQSLDPPASPRRFEET